MSKQYKDILNIINKVCQNNCCSKLKQDLKPRKDISFEIVLNTNKRFCDRFGKF